MNDIDKIVEIFQSGEYQLAIQLANGIGMSDMDLLQYIWDNYSNFDGESNDLGTVKYIQDCQFGVFNVGLDYYTDCNRYEYVLWDANCDDFYYSTLHNALNCILNIINQG